MKKWFISVMVLTTMLSLGGCWWVHHHHHGYAGERDGYNHHDRERDTYGDKDHYGRKDHDGWPK